jgi:hypothetical protein
MKTLLQNGKHAGHELSFVLKEILNSKPRLTDTFDAATIDPPLGYSHAQIKNDQ